MPLRTSLRSLLAASLLLLGSSFSPAPQALGVFQGGEAAPTLEEGPPPPEDPLDRGSPHGTIEGFLTAARQRDYERAAQYLDLSRLQPDERTSEGPELARQLKLVFDRVLWVEVGEVSRSAIGRRDDGLSPDSERIPGTRPKDAPEIGFFLERGPRDHGAGDETKIWRVATSTLERVPDLYERFGPGVVGHILPPTFVEVAFLEIYLWQWLALIVAMVVAYVAGWFAVALIKRALDPLTRRSKTQLDDQLVRLLMGPARLTLAVCAFAVLVSLLKLTVKAEVFFGNATKVVTIVALTWLVLRAIDLVADHARKRLVDRGLDAATYLIPTGTKALKFALGVLVLLAGLDTFGFDVTTLIASLGVGGLAVALALRPTLENIFGGIAVLVDEPVRPGQFCRYGDKVGTVEEVGLRSTRIRTLDRTVVSVPNSEFSTMQIENFAKRDRMRLVTTLGLRYETTADQLRHVTAELRRMLRSHPKVLPDPCRVRFINFGAYSLELEVFLYLDTADINEFLALREDLYLRMIDVVEASGTGFAFPSSTTYLARDGGLDKEKGRAAEKEVEEWRREGKLPYPEFGEEELKGMTGSLDWPPKGSAVG